MTRGWQAGNRGSRDMAGYSSIDAGSKAQHRRDTKEGMQIEDPTIACLRKTEIMSLIKSAKVTWSIVMSICQQTTNFVLFRNTNHLIAEEVR